MPHWLRHKWSKWTPGSDAIAKGAYDWRHYDVRTCATCGRRQLRTI